jgi:hypothetical protein
MKNTSPMKDKTKRVFTVYVGRKIFERYETTLAEATRVWSGICDDHPGVTVSLYDGYKRGLENLCSTGK